MPPGISELAGVIAHPNAESDIGSCEHDYTHRWRHNERMWTELLCQQRWKAYPPQGRKKRPDIETWHSPIGGGSFHNRHLGFSWYFTTFLVISKSKPVSQLDAKRSSIAGDNVLPQQRRRRIAVMTVQQIVN